MKTVQFYGGTARLLLAIILVPALCLAQGKYTEEELWKGIPIEKLPLAQLQLLVEYEPPHSMGMKGREFLAPHRIGIGLRNAGKGLIEEIDVSLIFLHRTAFVHLKVPDGKTLNYKMQLGSRGQMNLTDIQTGEEAWFSVMPLWDWFPEVSTSADGLHEIWWVVGASTSDRLVLRKSDQEFIPENVSEQGGLGYPPQSIGSP